VVILVGSLCAPAIAQEEEGHRPEHEEKHSTEHEAAEHTEHEFHRHHVSVFVGVTDGEVESAVVGAESEGGAVEDEQAFTLGLDYEYRLNRRWGVGALIDYAGKDFRSWVAGIPLVLHPRDGWKLLVAPGIEDRETEDSEFLVRAGVLYDFEVGRFTVTPALQVDFVDDDEILVYGVNLGRGF
jgi:hypothetical protein